jgi:hypothetical protein
MRFYPFGSSSLNQIYNAALAQTASIASYSATASYGVRILSASQATNGLRGENGTDGVCNPLAGPQGPTGSVGFGGSPGGVSVAYPSGSGY